MAVRLLPLAALCALLALSPSASAEHVQCGDTITQDTTLDGDVVCAEEILGNAITIAADDVTLDLAGHTVSGMRSYSDGSRGIGTDTARTGLAVLGGRVIGFSAGINLSASRTRIERVSSLDNGESGFSIRGDDNIVRRNEVLHTSEFGIFLRGDRVVLDQNVVRGPLGCAWVDGDDSQVTRNLLAACYWAGGATGYSSGSVVSRNTVTSNAQQFSIHGSGALVERNDFSGNAVAGVSISDPEAIVDRNVANDNSDDTESTPQGGIEIFTPGTIVTRNRADGNAEYGIWAAPGAVDGGGNRAAGNGAPEQCSGVRCK